MTPTMNLLSRILALIAVSLLLACAGQAPSQSKAAAKASNGPVFPAVLRGSGITGTVMAHVYVRPSGEVTEVRILKSPHDALSEAVRAYFSKASYLPNKNGFIAQYEYAVKDDTLTWLQP